MTYINKTLCIVCKLMHEMTHLVLFIQINTFSYWQQRLHAIKVIAKFSIVKINWIRNNDIDIQKRHCEHSHQTSLKKDHTIAQKPMTPCWTGQSLPVQWHHFLKVWTGKVRDCLLKLIFSCLEIVKQCFLFLKHSESYH